MKKTTFFKTVLLLCALIVGSGTMWAAVVTYTVSSKTAVSTSGTAPVGSSVTFSSNGNTAQQLTNGTGQTLTLSNFNGHKITQLVLSMRSNSKDGAGKLSYSTDGGTSYTYLVGSSGSGVAFNNSAWNGSYTTDYTDVTKTSLNIICGSSNVIFKIESTKNSIYCQSYSITYQEYDDNQVKTPTISIPTGTPFVSSKVVTMSTDTDGASIYYTKDGSTPTSSSLLYDSSNKPTISATTTIKAIAIKDGMTNSEIASETFTKETVLDGISALNSATTSTTATAHYVNLTNAQVTWTGTGNIGYLNDASAGIYIYGVSMTLNTKYNGVWKITTKQYNNMPEVTAFAAVTGEGTSEVASAMSPTEMTPSALDDAFTANLARQIKIIGYEVPVGKALTENIDLYGTSPYTDVTEGKTYTLVGYPYINSTTKTFRVVSAVEKPEAPTFSPAAGEFGTDFELTISATDGATIYYTTNGDTPDTSSTEYDPDDKPTISAGADVTVKAIAVLAGMTSDVASAAYEYKAVSKPTFDPIDGTQLFYGETVAISCDVDGSTIYYTTDGTTPTTSSSVYSTPVAITANSVTLKAMAKKGDDESSVASATYTLKAPAAPTATPGAGAVEIGTSVALSARAGTTIYYTTDGTDPDNTSTAYSSAITIDAAKTIKAVAYDGAGNEGAVLTAAYTIVKVATPTFTPTSGAFFDDVEVEINCATGGATIYYTTNGDTPTTGSTEYTGAISITSTTTVKAIAVKDNYANSTVASKTYTKTTVYSVTEVLNGTATGSDVYVKGFIVGEFVGKSTNPRTSSFTTDANIAIAAAFTDSPTVSGSIPVQLGTDALKSAWGCKTNGTTLFGYEVLVKGDITDYFSVTGIKNSESVDAISLPVSVGAKGYATYCNSDYALDFTDNSIKAYIATNAEGDEITMTQVNKIAKGEPVLLYSTTNSDSQSIPVATGAPSKKGATENYFRQGDGTTGYTWADSDNNRIYVLNTKTKAPGFYKANNNKVATTKAYLSMPAGVTARFGGLAFEDDETTGIADVKGKMEDVRGDFYDLSGRKVAQPTKGLYIMNGKKVIIK